MQVNDYPWTEYFRSCLWIRVKSASNYLSYVAMSVQNPQLAGFLVTDNRSIFSSWIITGWLHDCLLFPSPWYEADKCFDRIQICFQKYCIVYWSKRMTVFHLSYFAFEAFWDSPKLSGKTLETTFRLFVVKILPLTFLQNEVIVSMFIMIYESVYFTTCSMLLLGFLLTRSLMLSLLLSVFHDKS